MSDYSAHTIHAKHQHLGWNRDQPPIRTVTSGQILEFETIDASGGQIGPDSSEKAVTGLDPSRVNPLPGPVFIDGAEPGDALVVEVLDFAPSGWGWTAIIPGFGLLADEFSAPKLHFWRYDAHPPGTAAFGSDARYP